MNQSIKMSKYLRVILIFLGLTVIVWADCAYAQLMAPADIQSPVTEKEIQYLIQHLPEYGRLTKQFERSLEDAELKKFLKKMEDDGLPLNRFQYVYQIMFTAYLLNHEKPEHTMEVLKKEGYRQLTNQDEVALVIKYRPQFEAAFKEFSAP